MFTPLVNQFNAINAEIDRLIFDVWLAWLAAQLGPTPFWYALVIGFGLVAPVVLAGAAYLALTRLWPAELMQLRRPVPSPAGAGAGGAGRAAQAIRPAPSAERERQAAPEAERERRVAPAAAQASASPGSAPAAASAGGGGADAIQPGKPVNVSDEGRPVSPRGKVAKSLGG